MTEKDFREIEEATTQRYLKQVQDGHLIGTIGKIASTVATIAIHEYHKKLQEKEE